jgi:transmembrane sensor
MSVRRWRIWRAARHGRVDHMAKHLPPKDMQTPDLEEQAAELHTRRRGASWRETDQRLLDSRLAESSEFADAYGRIEGSWDAVGRYATSPELMALREQAIASARQASSRRWSLTGARSRRFKLWAAAAAVLVVCGTAWQLSPYGREADTYETGLGEQKVVELPDHSYIALDAQTRLHVRFTADARIVELLDGQAQFSVAKDPARPFKVEAGAKTIVAVGTVFDVEYVDRQVRVAMVEGRVAVLSKDPARSANMSDADSKAAPSSIELSAGQALQVRDDGAATLLPKADIEAATAWRQGKVIFRNEELAEAVHRLNRYSRTQVVLDDPALAQMRVSGVFESGDVHAFAEAMQAYLPVVAESSNSVIHLRMR